MQERLTLDKIPVKYLQWLTSARLKFLNDLLLGKSLRYFSAHLPVMATWHNSTNGENEQFPVNMTVKGIGLIPRIGLLNDYADIFESVIAAASTVPWDKSLHKRVEAITLLYKNIESFDPTLLGGLEIFEGKAFENLRINPCASLLYVGMTDTSEGMQYISFQVNGKVEVLEKDSSYYRFLLASRRLFEFDKFHLFQPDYPFGYIIKVMGVKDKSPRSRMSQEGNATKDPLKR